MLLKETTNYSITECSSTEDMQANIDEVNEQNLIDDNTVVGSMDVKSLYPNLDIFFTIEVVAEEYTRSEIKIEGVDYEEIGLYIALNRSKTYIENHGLSEYCPTRKRKKNKPKMTGSGSAKTKEKQPSYMCVYLNVFEYVAI